MSRRAFMWVLYELASCSCALFFEPGIYMVTAGTHKKTPILNSSDRLDFFMDSFFQLTDEFGWKLKAWAILSNHYHFIAESPDDAVSLPRLIGKLHMITAKQLNKWDNKPGRKVWFQYWDSLITFEASYLSRLNYVHTNPVHHGVANLSTNYPWCSASWFERNVAPSFVATVNRIKNDKIEIPDDF